MYPPTGKTKEQMKISQSSKLARQQNSNLTASLRGVAIGACLSLLLVPRVQVHSCTIHYSRTLVTTDETEDHGENGVSQTLVETSIVCIIVFLFLVTILFEEMRESMEEGASHYMRPVIESLFGEMTILGFLSACTFIITRTPFPYKLSQYIFGEHEFLVEIFEAVHFALFFVMVFFVIEVLVLVHESGHTEAQWKSLGRRSRQPPSSADSHDVKLFRALVTEFILERSVDPPFDPADQSHRVPQGFKFDRYLASCHGSKLAHVVHVNIRSWIFFIVLAFFFYGLMLVLENDFVWISWVLVVLGWMAMLLTLRFERYLQRVTLQLVPRWQTGDATQEGEALLGPDGVISLPSWCHINLEQYLRKRPWWKKYVIHETPNRQDSLFFLESEASENHLVLLQIMLVFVSVYCTLFFSIFLSEMWKEYQGTMGIFVTYVVLSIIPVAVIQRRSRKVLAATSLVSCVLARGRRPDIITDVLREDKVAHIVRAFILLDRMHRMSLTDQNDPLEQSTPNSASNNLGPEPESQFDIADVARTFDAMDLDGNGVLSAEELGKLMVTLGRPMTTEGLERMIFTLDVSQDGLISKDEFLLWHRNHVMGRLDDKTIDERAEALLALFDKDGDGRVSVGEFKNILDGFPVTFTVDEVGELVREIDEHGHGTIGLKEFKILLEKYYPKEMEEPHSHHRR